MTLRARLRLLASALPSNDSAVTLTRADLLSLAADADEATPSAGDLTVTDVAEEVGRASSTVRGWLIAGALRGYKLNSRDWRVPRSALCEYVNAQGEV
jgi:excisionase family DNA binding protein